MKPILWVMHLNSVIQLFCRKYCILKIVSVTHYNNIQRSFETWVSGGMIMNDLIKKKTNPLMDGSLFYTNRISTVANSQNARHFDNWYLRSPRKDVIILMTHNTTLNIKHILTLCSVTPQYFLEATSDTGVRNVGFSITTDGICSICLIMLISES